MPKALGYGGPVGTTAQEERPANDTAPYSCRDRVTAWKDVCQRPNKVWTLAIILILITFFLTAASEINPVVNDGCVGYAVAV